MITITMMILKKEPKEGLKTGQLGATIHRLISELGLRHFFTLLQATTRHQWSLGTLFSDNCLALKQSHLSQQFSRVPSSG